MNVWRLDERTADVFYGRTLDFFAAGTDAVSARDAFDTGYPGFAGLGVARDEEAIKEMEEPYIHHFPDGNASLARLIVRSLVPGVAPGSTMDDIVTARFDYAKLDVSGAPVRLRLEQHRGGRAKPRRRGRRRLRARRQARARARRPLHAWPVTT